MRSTIGLAFIIASSAFMGIMAFLTFTDTAWVLEGKPNESYPELIFGVVGLPFSLLLLALSIVADSALHRRNATKLKAKKNPPMAEA